MLLENESNSINGNTVLSPQRTALPNERIKREEEAKKKQQEKQKQQQRQQQKLHIALKFAGTLVVGFTVAFTVLFRYSSIYTTQNQLIQVNNEINSIAEENESLKVQLIKYNNISYIEEVATKELKMVSPIAGNAVYCNLKSIELPLEERNTKSGSITLFKKIKSFLF
jgi:cell division protein FtsL